MYYIYNGKLLKKNEKVNITPFSDGVMYGYGLFETIKIKEFKPILINEHLNRLRKGLNDLGIAFVYSDKKIKKMIFELIKKNNFNGALKLAVIKNKSVSDLVIIMKESNYNFRDYQRGFSLKISSVLRNTTSKVNRYKTLNYFENFLEFKKAREEKFDEVIFFNEKGFLAEGAISNIFIVKGNKIYTPSLDNGVLNGIMRQKVIDILDYQVIEDNIDRKVFKSADHIFITNSLMEIMPIREINSINYKSNDFTISSELRKKLYGGQ